MNKKARSTVIETEVKNTVIFDKQAEAELWTIVSVLEKISKNPLTKEQAQNFIYCLLDEFFSRSDDVAELEDRITEIKDVLTLFLARMEDSVEDEQ